MRQQLSKKLMQTIENLNEDLLHVLYSIVVARLQLLHKARALSAMKDFNILDRVSFTFNGKYMEGIVSRLNQKTISVTLDDGNRWNVSPGSLKRLADENPLKELLTKKQWEKLRKR